MWAKSEDCAYRCTVHCQGLSWSRDLGLAPELALTPSLATLQPVSHLAAHASRSRPWLRPLLRPYPASPIMIIPPMSHVPWGLSLPPLAEHTSLSSLCVVVGLDVCHLQPCHTGPSALSLCSVLVSSGPRLWLFGAFDPICCCDQHRWRRWVAATEGKA